MRGMALLLAATAAQAAGWRGGLTAQVSGTLASHRLVANSAEQKTKGSFRYRITTRARPGGLEIAISDAALLSWEGPAPMRAPFDRDLAFMQAEPIFLVDDAGEFAGIKDAAATVERVRKRMALLTSPGAKLKEVYVNSISEESLEVVLAGFWEAWARAGRTVEVGDSKAEPQSVTLGDGSAVGMKTRRQIEPMRCPDGKPGCKRLMVRGTVDAEAARSHLEAAMQKNFPGTQVPIYDQTVSMESLLSSELRPLTLKRVQRLRMVMTKGEQRDDTVQSDETNLSFNWR